MVIGLAGRSCFFELCGRSAVRRKGRQLPPFEVVHALNFVDINIQAKLLQLHDDAKALESAWAISYSISANVDLVWRLDDDDGCSGHD
jgi:hypothetical protein